VQIPDLDLGAGDGLARGHRLKKISVTT
jgi:hypothetical protein